VLPVDQEKLDVICVVILALIHLMNSVTRHISFEALRLLLAQRVRALVTRSTLFPDVRAVFFLAASNAIAALSAIVELLAVSDVTCHDLNSG
jgi:hypothetical protein